MKNRQTTGQSAKRGQEKRKSSNPFYRGASAEQVASALLKAKRSAKSPT